jgi:hypothetical protein
MEDLCNLADSFIFLSAKIERASELLAAGNLLIEHEHHLTCEGDESGPGRHAIITDLCCELHYITLI